MKVKEEFTEGQVLHGFIVRRIIEIKTSQQCFYELEHLATGARWIHLASEDTENVFGVIVKTIPEDSTGVPHILEHTVLCGSEKFPAKDPFFGMARRSLNTFMNAFTASDWTAYPFASQNKKDFYNLMDVYLDAVFFSRISRLHFLQEGWRIEFGENRDLEYKGVVYNEMKGAASETADVLERSLTNALFPTTTYGHNSGGDPADIPRLTHKQLKKFYRRFYHPSNAYFYSYGNFPLSEHLKFVAEKIMSRFERIDPRTEVELEPHWERPRTAAYYYPIGDNEDPGKKHQVVLGWLTVPIYDAYEVLIMELLEMILLGDAAAPLRKALIDSRLGSNLCDCSGFCADFRQTTFACGLKDVGESDASEIERLILSTLEKLANNGIDKELVESAFHRLELGRKEIKGGRFPRGLSFMFRMSASWIHGGDCLGGIDYARHFDKLREELARGPILENMIRKYLLDNPHRVLLTLSPKKGLAKEREERVRRELAVIKYGLTPADEEKIRRETAELEALQDSPDDFDCLPNLTIDDIPPKVKRIRGYRSRSLPCVTRYEQPTNDIFYFKAFWGIKTVPEELWPLLPVFCEFMGAVGTKKTDFEDWARRISAHTGGISLNVNAYTKTGAADNCLPLVELSAKCLSHKQEEMFSLIKELLSLYSFSDLERLKTSLLEYYSCIRDNVIGLGHSYALSLAVRRFSRTNALDEVWSGVHYIQTIMEMIDSGLTNEKLEKLSRDLTRIGECLLSNDWRVALVGEKKDLDRAIGLTGELCDCLPAPKPVVALDTVSLRPEKFYEGWSITVNVAYVASAFRTVDFFHRDAPALAVIAMLLKGKFIHREIREKGGAYGGWSVYQSSQGIFAFISYRDPNVASTLNVYEKAFDFIVNGFYEEEDIRDAILQVCAGLDSPLSPSREAESAFLCRILGISDQARQRYKERLLKVNLACVREVARRYFTSENLRACSVAVISSERKFTEENAKLVAAGKAPLKLHKIFS